VREEMRVCEVRMSDSEARREIDFMTSVRLVR